MRSREGDRIRCGEYAFEVKHHSGGGFEVDEWESLGTANIERLSG